MVVGDIHLSVKGPGARTDNYPNEILDKLRFIVEAANKNTCDAILFLGDVFHLKHPSRNPHWLVQSTHEVLTENSDIPVLICVGNHDISTDRLDSLDSQPLGALGRMKNMSIVIGPSPDFPEIYSIPYLQDWQELPKWFEEYNTYRADHPEIKRGVVMMHAPIFPDNQEPIYEYIRSSDVAKMVEHPTLVAFGHIHDPMGMWKPLEDRDVHIANFGAISRGSLHKETVKRKPQVYVYNTATGKHKALNVPVRPPEEVFDLEPHQLEQQRSQSLTGFLDGLDTQDSVTVGSVEQMLEHFSASDSISDEVKNTVSELLDFAQE